MTSTGNIYWLASYPKSGNTWMRLFLRNLQRNGEAPADINEYDDDVYTSIASLRKWMDEVMGFDTADLIPAEIERLRPEMYRWSSRNEKKIRYHKIHDAYIYTAENEPLVSREATLGVLYILRNPLDVASSAANHWNCSLDEAIARMGNPETVFPRSREKLASQLEQRLLDWSGHVLSWVDTPGLNRLTIRYEDMLQDPLNTFSRAAAFLQFPVVQERIEKSIRFSDFQELSRQEAEKGFNERPHHTGRFFRQGKSGGWRELLNTEQVGRIIADHGEVMRRFGYLDERGEPVG